MGYCHLLKSEGVIFPPPKEKMIGCSIRMYILPVWINELDTTRITHPVITRFTGLLAYVHLPVQTLKKKYNFDYIAVKVVFCDLNAL